MTRDQANFKIEGLVQDPEGLLTALEILGLLKFDQPPEANQIFFSAMADVPMEHRDIGKILAVINGLGLKLVEKK